MESVGRDDHGLHNGRPGSFDLTTGRGLLGLDPVGLCALGVGRRFARTSRYELGYGWLVQLDEEANLLVQIDRPANPGP
jgi:hypothetical protein